MDQPSGRRGATWALYGLVVASVVLPALVFAVGGVLAWRSLQQDARQDLRRSLSVAVEHATKVLDNQVLLADWVNELVGGMDDDAIRAQEGALRDRLLDMIHRFPQMSGVAVVGRDGHPDVATMHVRVDPNVSFSDREYFRKLRDSTQTIQIGSIGDGRFGSQSSFTVARRKGADPARFDGAIFVTVSPLYFGSFDRTLVNDSTDYAIGLFRDDGASLTRYPGAPNEAVSGTYGPVREAISREPLGGMLRVRSPADGDEWLIAYRKLDAYPVYATIGRRWDSLGAAWRRTMGVQLVFGLPATIALFLISLHVARRARRQADMLAALEAEVQRRETAEEALRQAQKMEAVGRLTGGIAHDFNNHLTVISSNIELLKRRVPSADEAVLRLADAAMQGVQRAATLTHRLLAFSRQQPLEPEPVDAGRLVAGMSDLLGRTLGETIRIETVLAGGLWLTRLDANQFENALLNLAVNARDAMPQGGRLVIETANAQLDQRYAAAHADAKAGAYVMVAVGDTGVGMSAETVAKAFEPFFTTKPLGQGTGLGLSMVYGFVRQSGGHVAIDSEPGQGSTVRLYLPRYVRQEEPQMAPRGLGTQAAGAGETILVVEDDEGVRRASVEALREMGYTVLDAPDAMEAFRLILDRGGIDLLFTDVGLPGGVNGRALADAARNAARGMKVLFTTGYTSAVLRDGAPDRGVHFLAKPFSLQQLAAKVREALDAPAPEEAAPVRSASED